MPKPAKSSASAATRKKHAKKSGKDDGPDIKPKSKGQKKLTKEEKKAKVKQYVPPPKPPAPAIPDPLDSQGLAHQLPAELVVTLRRLGKKDDVTRRKGLEELRDDWIRPMVQPKTSEDQELARELKESALLVAIPIWLHHLAGLLQSPSHRIPTLQIQQDFLSFPALRQAFLSSLSLGFLQESQVRDIIGSWMVAAVEDSKRANGASLVVWTNAVSFGETPDRLDLQPHIDNLTEYLSLSIFSWTTLHTSIYPTIGQPQPPADNSPNGEDIETLSERMVWYRAGGLAGLTWLVQQADHPLHETLSTLLQDERLWSSLSCRAASLGNNEPTIRRSAFLLLSQVTSKHPTIIEDCREVLQQDLLADCWLETSASVWEVAGPVLATILTSYRAWWTKQLPDPKADASDDESDEEADDDNEDSNHFIEISFSHFLEFISTICPTIPQLTYPLVLVTLSVTAPSWGLDDNKKSPALETLFAHLWSPVYARLLSTHALPGQQSAIQTFLHSAMDCTLLLIGRAKTRSEADDLINWLVNDQMGESCWKQVVLELGGRSGGRRVTGPDAEGEATIFGSACARLDRLSSVKARELLQYAVDTLLETSLEDSAHERLTQRIGAIMGTLYTNVPTGLQDVLDSAVANIATRIVGDMTSESTASTLIPRVDLLTHILRTRAALVSAGTVEKLAQPWPHSVIDKISPHRFVELMQTISSLSGPVKTCVQTLMTALIFEVDVPLAKRLSLMSEAFASSGDLLFENGGTPRLDELMVVATKAALEGANDASDAISSAMNLNVMSPETRLTILALCSTAIINSTHELLTSSSSSLPSRGALAIFNSYASIHMAEVAGSEVYSPALVAAHHLAMLLPRLDGHLACPPEAEALWSCVADSDPDIKAKMRGQTMTSLRELVLNTSCPVRPEYLVDAAVDLYPDEIHDAVQTLLPLSRDLPTELMSIITRPPYPTLAMLDPLVSHHDTLPSETSLDDFDNAGRSRAARLAETVIAALRSSRNLVPQAPHLLCTILAVRTLAIDAMAVPKGSRGCFGPSASPDLLESFIRETDGALSFVLGSVPDQTTSWQTAMISMLSTFSTARGQDVIQNVLVELAHLIEITSSDIPARAFRDVLVRVLRQVGAGEADASTWLSFAMSSFRKIPMLSMAVILAIKNTLMESDVLHRAQNRLADTLAGVKTTQMGAEGVMALRLLLASAPPIDAAAEFLPPQRALFVLRHVLSWLADDSIDDLPEDLEFRLAELCTILAPTIQNVPGGHWDQVFDLLESGLEAASLSDPDSVCFTYQSLLLLRTIRDLCTTNKSLRAAWTEKQKHYELVLKLFVQCRDVSSEPIQRVQELLLDLVIDMEDSTFVSGDTQSGPSVAELVNLIHLSGNWAIQTLAYRILSQVIKHDTLALVLQVEASISDSEEAQASTTITLPSAITEVASRGSALNSQPEPMLSETIAQLLAWMAILDYFEDASRKIRWAYLDQLNGANLIQGSLLPMLFEILGVSEVGAWNFPANQYAVEEFYPELLQPENLADVSPLASHLYYRTLILFSSTIRIYYQGLKDRQLSMSMLNFTAKNFSPVIIQNEFAALREPSAMAQLTEEGLSVRISHGGGAMAASGSGSAEAIASYVVDEQPMEIGIRLPAEFPLRGVDVRDLRRVGVPENKWRGWLLSVQQTITSRNGLILEALTVFKKNVSLHFEGVVECAICYSIISLTDRTLPTKPCRTCKNRFHASCLFKWFNSSHSSSCPLCRALF